MNGRLRCAPPLCAIQPSLRGWNQARKLDAVVPSWVEGGTTDVVRAHRSRARASRRQPVVTATCAQQQSSSSQSALTVCGTGFNYAEQRVWQPPASMATSTETPPGGLPAKSKAAWLWSMGTYIASTSLHLAGWAAQGCTCRVCRHMCPHQVTCGGVQSAHTAAVAAAAANHGMRSHLLVRGEAPACPTGYHLIARMFGHVTYVSRADYVDRVALLERHAAAVEEQGRQEGRKVRGWATGLPACCPGRGHAGGVGGGQDCSSESVVSRRQQGQGQGGPPHTYTCQTTDTLHRVIAADP